jgi:hypothetical protein
MRLPMVVQESFDASRTGRHRAAPPWASGGEKEKKRWLNLTMS